MYTSSDSFIFKYFQYSFLRDQGYGKYDTIQRADLRISDIGNLVGSDWVNLAHELDISDSDINIVKSEYPDSDGKLNQIQNYEFCMKLRIPGDHVHPIFSCFRPASYCNVTSLAKYTRKSSHR